MTKLTDYKPLQRNPNKGTQRGTGILEQSVRELGAGRSILVDKNGVILAGNHAQEAFVNAGMDDVIEVETDGKKIVVVKRTDLDAESSAGKKMAIMDNRTSEQGLAWDAVVVEDLLNEIKQDEGELDNYLESLAKDTGAVIGDPPAEDQGAQIDKAEELRVKWGVELGQLWQLGEHRLICGDCTDKAVVDRLMDGDKADMVFTDPPYNVSYQANESIESLKKRNRRTDGMVVENDSMSDAEFDIFLTSFLEVMPLKSGGSYYLCSPPGSAETQFRNALNSIKSMQLRECIVWVKDRFVFGRQDYHWRHESILYGWKDGDSHYFIDDRTQDTVWEIKRPSVSEFHPTMKPVELPEKAIQNSSKDGWIVYEPFSGSGTTLIACERLNRKCRAVEISPAYCAVAIQRWVDMTGQEPVLLGTKPTP